MPHNIHASFTINESKNNNLGKKKDKLTQRQQKNFSLSTFISSQIQNQKPWIKI